MRKMLGSKFFERSSIVVAKDLIGKFLIREQGGEVESFMITETEAYDGEKDLACHASKGRTKRTEILYAKPGIFYIYLIYGMYHMLNIVTDKKDYPSAVLIRGVKSISGPGRVTKKLKIDRMLHGKEAGKKSSLWLEDRGIMVNQKDILKTARIGVDYAGPIWSKKLYRFLLKK